MKAKNLILGISAVLLLSLGLNVYQLWSMTQERTKNDTLSAEVARYGDLYTPVYKYFTSLTVDEFKQKVASGEHFTVYIGRPDCNDCTTFEPTFEQVIADEHLENKMYYLNVRWLREGGASVWEPFKETYGFTQTPAFSTYKDGKQISMIEWTEKGLSRSVLESWLKTQGIM